MQIIDETGKVIKTVQDTAETPSSNSNPPKPNNGNGNRDFVPILNQERFGGRSIKIDGIDYQLDYIAKARLGLLVKRHNSISLLGYNSKTNKYDWNNQIGDVCEIDTEGTQVIVKLTTNEAVAYPIEEKALFDKILSIIAKASENNLSAVQYQFI
jgi:hypothetical protein